MLLPLKIPEWHYHYPGNGITFKMLETLIEKHFEIGEKYLEYVRYASLDPSCYHCSALGWAGPVSSNIEAVRHPFLRWWMRWCKVVEFEVLEFEVVDVHHLIY